MYSREEGDLNSRGQKTNGLAVHRRTGLGHPRIYFYGIKVNDKNVMIK